MKSFHQLREAYNSYQNNRTGFARRPREDDEYHNEPKAKFKPKSMLDRPHTVHIDGKPWKKFDNGHQAMAAVKTLEGKGKNAVAIAHFKEEVQNEAVHRIGLTVTDPNHPMVSKRKETIQKSVRVKGDDREKAINSAIAHYKRKGYKVHDHHYIGTVNEAKDAREYDYEGDMAKSQLRSIIANAQKAHDMLEDDTNMAEWVQSKITLAADYISTVADYMQSEIKEESDLYAKAEENKRSADAAKSQARPFDYHMHMADHHDNLAQWHASKGRHSVADTHAAKSDDHHQKAMAVKEEVDLDEAVGHTIEAHGIKGMKGTPWRKTFKSHEHLNDWAEKNDSVEVHGTRDLEGAKKKTNEETQIDEVKMTAAMKLQRAFQREQERSARARRAGEELLNPAKKMQDKEASVTAAHEPAAGAAKTFSAIRKK